LREDYYALHMVDIHCIFAITIVIPSHKYPKDSKPKTTILLIETLYFGYKISKL